MTTDIAKGLNSRKPQSHTICFAVDLTTACVVSPKDPLLLFAMIRSVAKSFKVPVVEVAELTGQFHWILPWTLRCPVRRVSVANKQVSPVLWQSSTVSTDVAWFAEHHVLVSCRRWQSPDRSCERMHHCFLFSPGSSSAIGDGRLFSTLWFPWSLMTESTTCVCRFWRLAFLLAPSQGRAVERCLKWRVSFMGLGLSS